MKLHLLGTGTPILDPQRPATSAFLLEIGPDKILFDAGRGVTTQLLKQGISAAEVDFLFITHHHFDHISGLGDFLLTGWHNGRTRPLQIFGPSGTARIISALIEQVYARDITFALFTEPERVDIRELVRVKDVEPGPVYRHGDWQVACDYVNHGHSLGLSHEEWPCLGYRLEQTGKAIAIGGDAVACAALNSLAHRADALVLSCYLAEKEVVQLGFQRLAAHVIASSGQVGQIAHEARVKKLVLTHFRPKSAELMRALAADVRADYDGEIILGDELMIIEI